MPTDARVWRVTSDNRLEEIRPGRLDLEERIQGWLESDIGILSPDLLVIGREVPTAYGGFIDLLCIGPTGDLTVVELKRDRTPREVTAQALDYASWVVDLGHDEVLAVAAEYFGRRGTSFEAAFRERFGGELPEVINESHAMVVVGSEIDDSSERIIRYLSEHHGVNINAARFQFLRGAKGEEYLARVFLLEPGEVEKAARAKSRRAPNLSVEALRELARERGVEGLYQRLEDGLRPVLGCGTRRSALVFVAGLAGRRRTVIGLVPGESSQAEGVKFYCYTHRLAALLERDESEVRAQLPASAGPWEYKPDESDDFRGVSGFFRSEDEVAKLVEYLRSHTA